MSTESDSGHASPEERRTVAGNAAEYSPDVPASQAESREIAAGESQTEQDVTPDDEAGASSADASLSRDNSAQESATEEPVGEGLPVDEAESGDDEDMDVEPLELIADSDTEESAPMTWYILKVQVNREESIRDALLRRVKIEGLEEYFGEIVVPTEDVAEFTKAGKRRVVKKKLYPGYIMINMVLSDDTWFLVRETPGIGDFTGSAGRPAPMDPADVERLLKLGQEDEDGEQQVKTAIPFHVGDHVRVKEGNFENFEGDVDNVDEAKGRVTVKINIFGRSTPVEFEHWQIEAI